MQQLHSAELKISTIHGRGLYATEDIKTGAVVWKNNFTAQDTKDWLSYTRAEIDDLKEPAKTLARTYYEYGGGKYHGPATTEIVERDASNFFNHNCDPNLQFIDDDTLVALRPILKGEELAYDYSTAKPLPIDGFDCRCCSKKCRFKVTYMDYKKLNHLGKVSHWLNPGN